MDPEEIRSAAVTIRASTDAPFNLNFFAHPEPRGNPALDARARALVTPFYAELGLEEVPEKGVAPCPTFRDETLKTVLEIAPNVVSFHFGLPPQRMTEALRNAGCLVLCSATTVGEALALQDAGVDVIIAQGWEAGGHRGTFEPTAEDFGIGTLALVPQVVDAVDVPVVAAGGIADGRGIAAAFALGASGVQLGTAFLSCPEANINEAWRAALRDATVEDTRLTRAYSGRPARALNNRYVQATRLERAALPEFPTMYAFSEPLAQHSASRGETGFQFLLYGQAAALNREMPAAELMTRLVEDARNVFRAQSPERSPDSP